MLSATLWIWGKKKEINILTWQRLISQMTMTVLTTK